MEWTAVLNRAISYMEENLLRELTCQEVAEHIHFSSFHFQRAFSLMTGMTVGEYLRCRRLSLAGEELRDGKLRVIDAALKYGYETPESFAKAFRRFHGVAPSHAGNPGCTLKSFSRLLIKIYLEGGTAMEYRIEEKGSFRVTITTRPFTDENSKTGIPAFWADYFAAGLADRVCGQLGICLPWEAGEKEWRYGIGCLEPMAIGLPEGFEVLEIPAHTWAVFTSIGALPDALQSLWGRVYSEWLPQSGYELLPGCDMELYTVGDTSSPQYRSEIWLPVKKKEA